MLTINNPTDEDRAAIQVNDKLRYFCYQLEQGEEGTVHVQAFLYYHNARTGKTLKKEFPRAHIENVMQIPEAIAYCKKEETRVEGPWEGGEPPEQGKRTDLQDVAHAIKVEKKTPEQIAEEFPVLWIKYARGIQSLFDNLYKDRTEAPHVTWLWGESRTGKTHYVESRHPRSELYVKDHTQWWPRYRQQPAIIIDDFEGQWPFRDFLRFLDYLPYQGQTKGGYVSINSPHVYISSEHPPHHYYNGTHLTQVLNRLDECVHKTKVYPKHLRKKCVFREEA